jgi:PAS domain S-box-containing protein
MDEAIISNSNELHRIKLELSLQKDENASLTAALSLLKKKLDLLHSERLEMADELGIANIELAFQYNEKEKWADELIIANKELAFQKDEKAKRADELGIANKELAFQDEEKGKRAEELGIAIIELAFQDDEKGKRAEELVVANKELIFQNKEKDKRAMELIIANKELNQSEKLLKDSLKEVSDYKDALDSTAIIALTDHRGMIKKANPNFCKISKYNEEELIGKDHRILNSGFHSKAFMHDLWQTIAKGKMWKGEIKNKAKDGTFYWVDTTIVPFLDEQGKPYQYLAIRVDITKRVVADMALEIQNKEREKLAAELVIENYSRGLIEASLDPLFTISPEGKITDMNLATVRVIEKSREQLIGSNFIDCFTEPKKAKVGYQQVFEKGFVVDCPLTIKDGKLTDVLFNGSVYKDGNGNILGAVVVARDITEQKRIENELIESKIFAEFATLIAEEAKTNAENSTLIAENAVKAKQQFLSNMSHEIRTPMNAIIGFTKVLLKTELSSKQSEYLSAIKLSGDALIVLINDILDLAKVDAGKMLFEQTPFKISLSISSMLHLFDTKIQEKNLVLVKEYDKQIPEVLLGDPVRLHQIILNLVSNAVKFTSHGSITLSVRLIKQDESKVTIEFAVSDTGIGIPDQKIDKIFENFQQASSGTSRIYGGTGLGLAIVKQLVEQQGGVVGVKSEIGKGSTFSFTLSFYKTKATAEIEVETIILDNEIKNINVLVVEDIALNQLLMKTLLDDYGFEREIAANGKIAIEKLQAKTYDIILMDLQMPEMNGFEATEYIRNTLHSKIPIIALTADVTTVDLEKCKAVGMNDYIAKPVDEKILYNKILGLVKKPIPSSEIVKKEFDNEHTPKLRYIDLSYLSHRTKSNPSLMMEMIVLYLKQTPSLVESMKRGLYDKDWDSLQSAVHKMIPSFSIMGISSDFESMAKKIQEYANTQKQTDGIHDLVLQLENVCNQACIELEIELDKIRKSKNDE